MKIIDKYTIVLEYIIDKDSKLWYASVPGCRGFGGYSKTEIGAVQNMLKSRDKYLNNMKKRLS